MKAVHIVNHSFPVVDGYSIRTQYLARSQQKLGFDPVIVTRPGFADQCPVALSFREDNDGIPHFHFVDTDYPLVRLMKRMRRARNYLRRHYTASYYRRVYQECAPCSVLHVHMLPDLVHHLLPLSRQYHVPIVYEIRGVWEDTQVACGQLRPDSPVYKKRRDAATRAAKAADMVITISEGLRQDFVSRGVTADKITVVPNGVDTSFFVPRPRDVRLAAQHNLTGKMVFGYISTIRRLEGIEYLVTAMPEIVKCVPDARCLIVGDGDYAPRLRALVNKLGLQNNVVMPGKVKHEEILAYYSLIDVFVVPRPNIRVNNLVTPLKPLEAMSMEKALLVSGVGGLAELVQDGRTGLIFKPEDAIDLAGKATMLAASSELRQRLGEEARRYVVQERDWTDVIGSYQESTIKIAMERLTRRTQSRATA